MVACVSCLTIIGLMAVGAWWAWLIAEPRSQAVTWAPPMIAGSSARPG